MPFNVTTVDDNITESDKRFFWPSLPTHYQIVLVLVTLIKQLWPYLKYSDFQLYIYMLTELIMCVLDLVMSFNQSAYTNEYVKTVLVLSSPSLSDFAL